MSHTPCLVCADGSQFVTFGVAATGGRPALTVETWLRADVIAEVNRPLVAQWAAAGWALYVMRDGRVVLLVGDTVVYSTTGALVAGLWQHVAGTYDAVAATGRLFVAGVDVTEDVQGPLAVTPAAVQPVRLGGTLVDPDYGFGGRFGWGRVSSTVRYAAGFTPVREYPAVDGYTLLQWHLAEGAGSVTANAQGDAALDGVLSGATWGWWPVSGVCVRRLWPRRLALVLAERTVDRSLRRRMGRPMWA